MKSILIMAVSLMLMRSGRAAVLPGGAVIGGRSVGEWSVECWKWVYSLPISRDPSLDCDGRWANEQQPGGNVFFIAPLSGATDPPCIRTFTVPANKYLLVPLLVITADNIDTVPPLTIEQLYDAVDPLVSAPEDLRHHRRGGGYQPASIPRNLSPL
jgi:hypothetical protein